MMPGKTIVQFFILILEFQSFHCTNVTFFKLANKRGKIWSHDLSQSDRQCYNVPHGAKEVRSIDTGDLCLNMYAEENCLGDNAIQTYPGLSDPHNLELWDFDTTLVSFQVCDPLEEGNTLILHSIDWDVKGKYISVFGCKNLPEDWRRQTSGSNSFSQCFKFYSELNCTGDHIQIDSSTPENVKYDFKYQQFNQKTVSIGLCSEEEKPKSPTIRTITNKNSGPSVTTARNLSTTTNEKYSGVAIIYLNATTDTTTNIEYTISTTDKYTEISSLADDSESEIGASTTDSIIIIEKKPTVMLLIIFSVIVLLLILLGLASIAVILFKRKEVYRANVEVDIEMANTNFIERFFKGNPDIYSTKLINNADAGDIAQNMPYDHNTYEIPLECFEFDIMSVLGSGQFGEVRRAKMNNPKTVGSSCDVAVKTVRPNSDVEYIKTFLEELKIMMYLRGADIRIPHENVLNIIGACTEALHKLEPYIVLELCDGGSLDKFLRKNRKNFCNLVEDGQFVPPMIILEDYNELPMNTIHLMKWSQQIADGMKYLSSKKVIHADLAARNILLTDQLCAKISDFGLSRRMYQYSNYIRSQSAQTPLPWRWMALECLQDMNFSTESDVWAFGVTMWEIFTLGQVPLPDCTWNVEFMESLENGSRMEKPKYSTISIYDLMHQCWKTDPDERISFANLNSELSSLLNSTTVRMTSNGYMTSFVP